MNRRIGLPVWIILALLSVDLLVIPSGYGFERQQPLPVPHHPKSHSPSSPQGSSGFCTIQHDADTSDLDYYFDKFEAGDGIAVYMNPKECGHDSTYPFKISNVHFYLYDPGTFVWPVEIAVKIVYADTSEDSLTHGTLIPGGIRHQITFSIPEDSAYDPESRSDPINLTLDTVFCVTDSFFLQVDYTGGTFSPYPSLVMSDVADLPDTLNNWVRWNNSYVEWYDFWENPVPGRAIIRVTGYSYAVDCHSCWDWMSKKAQVPNGMPDFSQYQFASDSSAMCGPTSLANCLVWLDAIPSGADPDSLIRLLSDYLNTDPGSGTLVDSVTAGLDSLFADYGLDLYSALLENPTFSETADSLAEGASIAILVGLWQEIGGIWYRIGGHYISVPGACQESSWTALSDPAVDNAEEGGRGRFLPPHDPHPDDSTLHNTNGFVSHDAYLSDTLTVGPFAAAWILRDLHGEDVPWISGFDGLNLQPDQDYHAYDPAESLYAVVEYAIMILEKPTLVIGEEEILPGHFRLAQSYPNPFNNQTVITYHLSTRAEVSLVIYNILGQKVRTLVDNERQSGAVSVSWDGKDDQGKDLSSGIYFYQLRAGELTQTRRMVLLK
ncbi:MAG: T9SS type A sorting domain-containing protein [Candidatus Zixiibacteriota bacterium]|nr:MAG: T9SS type A sorting domain-containing protein [candidate division Zixibacteria bacterium]